MKLFLCCRLILLFAVAKLCTSATTRRCDQLPRVAYNMNWIKEKNNFAMFRSTSDIFKCARVVMVDPVTVGSDILSTAVVIRPNQVFNFALNLTESFLTWNATYCIDGSSAIYRTSFANFAGTNAAFCVVSCGADGASYKMVNCLGKSPADKALIDEFVTRYEIPGVLNMQESCTNENIFCQTFHGTG
ncbi:hypothetical protein CHUAL_005119 [Chamberlinius hualienensis]